MDTTSSIFLYRAVDRENRVRSGSVEAAGRVDALIALAGDSLTVVELVEAPARAKTNRGSTSVRRFRLFRASPSLDEVQTLIAEWARCLEVGLTIAAAVSISADSQSDTKLGLTMNAIQTALRSGVALHRALAEHVPRLSPALLSLIEAGERSGQLGPTLTRLAERLGHERKLRGEIRSALVYPAFVVTTAFVVVFILLHAVVPAIGDIIGERRYELPFSAQIVLQASSAVREWGSEILLGAVGLAFAVLTFVMHPSTRSLRDRLNVRLPLVGSLLLANDAAQFARTLAAQFGGGIPLGRATRLSVSSFALEPVRKAASNLERKLSEGRSLSEAVATDLPQMPRELAQFMRVGEQTGRLAILLEHAADLIEERARRQMRTLTSLLTPAITIGLGLLVGFIVLSMMNAIVGLNAVALR